MDTHLNESHDPIAPNPAIDEEWTTAVTVLEQLFRSEHGCVSSRMFRQQLERKGILDARSLVVRLKFFDFDGEADESVPPPPFRFYHRGRSFYSEEAYRAATAKTDEEAVEAGVEEVATADDDEVAVLKYRRRAYRQDEARLVRYVRDALETIYASDYGPDVEMSFDVHNQRAGSDYENVDLIAVHWRSDSVVELIAVEVKLDFTAKLIQQAGNYRRFANRVWIACPVTASPGETASELRERDQLLFEHTVELGIGVLACRRTRGRAYDVWPIHWPRLLHPDPVERGAFVERHRSVFEEAGAVEPQRHKRYPKLQ